MQYEVEQKHRLDDATALIVELKSRGVSLGPVERHVDTYYNHPSRDFAHTDEALRVRQIGATNFVTYKGPKIDSTTKTRRELELPIAPGAAAAQQFGELLLALGFLRVAEVTKLRRSFRLLVTGYEVTGTLDEVEGVGKFAELEITADETNLKEAQRAVAALADDLRLGPGERRSYLEMLLEKT